MAIAGGSVVLAVDENPATRKLLRRILLGAGLGCVEAADGESGLGLAVEAGVSAAVVDLVLPGMSGAELAWRLREQIPGLPVVAVSGSLDIWDADDLRDLGIREVLPKPFEQKKLVRAVVDSLAHPRLHRPGPLRSPEARPPRRARLAPGRAAEPSSRHGRASAEVYPPERGSAGRRSRRPAAADEQKQQEVPHGTH